MSDLFPQLEKKVQHSFSDYDLLRDALTHSSTGRATNYERLEFLGDRVLGLVIAEILYERFPEEPEGHMAKRLAALVQGSMLATIAREIDLGMFIKFSEAESAAGGAQNDNILADVFEAVIGALYLDGGFGKSRAMIERLWDTHFDEMKAPPQHPKTTLQEWAQGAGLPLPDYEITGQDGPDHAPEFEITLRVKGYEAMVARGRSRQEAEKSVAEMFLNNVGEL